MKRRMSFERRAQFKLILQAETMKRYKKAQRLPGTRKLQDRLLRIIQDHDDLYETAQAERRDNDLEFTQWIANFFFSQIDQPYNFEQMKRKAPDDGEPSVTGTPVMSWF